MDLLRRAPVTLSLAVLALLALLAALKLAQSVAAPVTLGFVVGVVFAPMATRMGRIGAPPAISATVALALAGLVLTVLISAAGPVVTELLEQVPKIEAELRRHPRGPSGVSAVVIDIHAEATSEKMAMGHYFDGKASLVVGTHTHVPTGDAMLLPGGTGYLTDAGMCGDYNSVIGMDKGEPLRRFITGMPGGRFTPADGPVTVSGVIVETDDRTGLATAIRPLRHGGKLIQRG